MLAVHDNGLLLSFPSSAESPVPSSPPSSGSTSDYILVDPSPSSSSPTTSSSSATRRQQQQQNNVDNNSKTNGNGEIISSGNNNNNNNNSGSISLIPPGLYQHLPPHFVCYACQQKASRLNSSENSASHLLIAESNADDYDDDDESNSPPDVNNNNNDTAPNKQQQQRRHRRRQSKLLPCHHSICYDCITTLTTQHKFFLACPICKQHFPIPNNRSYPTNWLFADHHHQQQASNNNFGLFHHDSSNKSPMASTAAIIANIADDRHETSSTDSGTHQQHLENDDDTLGGPKTSLCPLHDLQPLEYFCQTCDYAVCVDCLKPPVVKLDSSEEFLSADYASSTSSTAPHSSVSRHEGHSYTPLTAARKVERVKIARLAQALQMRIGEAEDASEHLKSIEQNLSQRLEDALSLINKSFDKIIERLNQRKLDLENQLSATCQQKQQVIDTNRQAVGNCIASAKESADFLQRLLEQGLENNDDELLATSSNLDLLLVRKQLEQQTEVVLQPFPLNTVHLEETQLLFNFVDCGSDKLLRSVDSFGAIISNGSNDMASNINNALLSPVDGDDAKSVSSLAANSTSDYLLRSSQNIATAGSLPIDVMVRLASLSAATVANMSAADRLRSWSSCLVGVPQVAMLTAVDEHGIDAPLPNNHDRALTVVIRDAVERVGTCDLKRVSAAGFLLTYTIPKEGIYEMEICLFGMPVSSSPFVVRCYPVGTPIQTAHQSSNSGSTLAVNSQLPVLANNHSHNTTMSRIQNGKKPPHSPITNGKAGATSKLLPASARSKSPNSIVDDLKLASKFNSSSANASENTTPRPSFSTSSRLSVSKQLTTPCSGVNGASSTRPPPGTFRSKTTLSDRTRIRSKSQSGSKLGIVSANGQLRHAPECPSHPDASNNGNGMSNGGNKPAELEQLRNFCKRVVLLTSGHGGDSASVYGESERQKLGSDVSPSAGSAITHSSHVNTHFDDFLFSFGKKGRGKGEFSNIQDVCVAADGRLIVSDSGNQCIQVFSSTGEFRFRFGVAGRNPGQLARPTGIATSSLPGDDKFYIADYENRCVHIFNDDGRHIGRLGVGRLLGPKGICLVPSTSLIVVVDNRASEVSIFDIRSHKLASKFGSRGSQPHQLAGPHFAAILDNRFCRSNNDNNKADNGSITVSSRPRIAITDFHNHAVKVFDLDGNLQSVIGNGIGDGPGQFNAATGLAVDGADGGTLYAADWGNSRVQVFGAGGNTFRSIVNCYSGQPLFGPQGLAIDPQKMRLAVADSGNHCIKIFRSASQTNCYL